MHRVWHALSCGQESRRCVSPRPPFITALVTNFLERRGHTETGVDLCALTGLPRAGVLCELVEDNETGSMMRRDGCRRFADRWGLKMISIEQLVRWREEREGTKRA